MPTIMFVCTANRYRSPIAAACFSHELTKHKPGNNWKVLSAGTWTSDGLPPMPEAIRMAEQLGLDIQAHRSRVVTSNAIEQADLILVMEQSQKEALQIEFHPARNKILLLTEIENQPPFDIPDPIKDPLNIDIVSKMCGVIRSDFEKICALVIGNYEKR